MRFPEIISGSRVAAERAARQWAIANGVDHNTGRHRRTERAAVSRNDRVYREGKAGKTCPNCGEAGEKAQQVVVARPPPDSVARDNAGEHGR